MLPAVPMAAAEASSPADTRAVQKSDLPERPPARGLDEKAPPRMTISPEDQRVINEVIEGLVQQHAFDSEESYVCARAMLSALALGTNNPDKVAKAIGFNRTKIREWFTNLRTSQVIEVDAKGKSTGVWCVDWFEEHGLMHLIMDVACAQGLLRRVLSED